METLSILHDFLTDADPMTVGAMLLVAMIGCVAAYRLIFREGVDYIAETLNAYFGVPRSCLPRQYPDDYRPDTSAYSWNINRHNYEFGRDTDHGE